MKIKKSLIKRIKRVLIHNVGDHRECPHCKKSFIPNDATASESWVLHKELQELEKNA